MIERVSSKYILLYSLLIKLFYLCGLPNQRRPCESGDPLGVGRKMESRFRGNDTKGALFRRAQGGEESLSAGKALRARFFASLRMTDF